MDRVLRVWKAGCFPIVKITFDRGLLFATPEHKIRLLGGNYVEAGNLKVGDKVRILRRGLNMDNLPYWNIYRPAGQKQKVKNSRNTAG